MKILMITQDYKPNPIGGIGVHAANLSEALHDLCIDITTLTLGSSYNIRNESYVRRAHISDIKFSERHGPKNFSIFQSNIALATLGSRLGSFDLIHCQDIFAILAADALASIDNIPLVLTKHNVRLPRKVYVTPRDKLTDFETETEENISKLQEWCFTRPNKLIAVSNYIRDSIIALKPEVSEKCIAIPNGFDADSFSSRHFSTTFARNTLCQPGEYMLLIVGRIAWTKGGDIAISALKALKHLNLRLIFVGEGDYRSYLEKYSAELGISDKVTFLGYIERENISQLYAETDIVLLPSRPNSEGFPLTILEAMNFGKLVIASKVGGIENEQISHNYNGLLFEPENHESLAYQIDWILSHPSEITRISTNAKEYAINFPSWNIIAERTLEVYKEAYLSHRRRT